MQAKAQELDFVGKSPAALQTHLANEAFRTTEQRCPLFRYTNRHLEARRLLTDRAFSRVKADITSTARTYRPLDA
jgi:hypothetical protein